MSFDDLRRRADRVRDLPLESVLPLLGATRDQRDKSKWHTEQGSLSITGSKFMNWRLGRGGGGAIDLVMQLLDVDSSSAIEWLERYLVGVDVSAQDAWPRPTHSALRVRCGAEGETGTAPRLPIRDDRQWARVLSYLTVYRRLERSLLAPLLESGRLYADSRGNAVFVLVAGKAQRPVGAELRGTGPRVWRGMSPGTRKDLGYFWIGERGSRELVLCESAIDAISCHQVHPQRICLSTSGARSDPAWLHGLIARGFIIHCGFDADEAGDSAARQMITLHPAVRRLRPPAHDWNDVFADGY